MTAVALAGTARTGTASRLLGAGALVVVWAAGIGMVLLTVTYGRRWGMGTDAHAYWLAAQHLSYVRPPRQVDAFVYSPLFADVLRPLGYLPAPVFYGVWLAASAAALCWLLRPLPTRWAVPVALLCSVEFLFGNIHLLLAAALVAGLRGSRTVWLLPVLTKVATGVGLLWFVARGEWRRVAEIAAVFVLVVGGSYLVQPAAWTAWVGLLLRHGSTPDGSASFAVRAVAAVVIVAVAARTGIAWPVAVATMLANPVSVLSGLVLLVAIPQLATGASPTLSRSTASRASSPTPSRSTASPV